MNEVNFTFMFFEIVKAWFWPFVIAVLLSAYQARHKALDTMYKTKLGKWLIDKWMSYLNAPVEYQPERRTKRNKKKNRR